MDIHNIMKEGYLDPIDEMKDLILYLNEATRLYDLGTPAISDRRWDNRYYRLVQLEKETGTILPNSPTQSIYFEVKDKLDKIKHEHLMLSLDKTKDIEVVKSFLGNREWVAMSKMDGLTCSLTYENGELVRAETRGNGEEGEDILHNAKANLTIPNHIPYNKRVVIDGEIICTYKEFKNWKNEFKNPRNFAAGSIRLLNSHESRDRFLTFVAWDVIEFIELPKFIKEQHTLIRQLGKVEDWGFNTPAMVWNAIGSKISVEDAIDHIKGDSETLGYPIDGVVFKFNDLDLRESLGYTAHHFNNAIAFKFFDDLYDTRLKHITWTMGRTGVLTPVAVFEPIDIDGSTVERASLHNVSIMRELLGNCAYVGEPLKIYKANQIIPQIAEAGPHYDYGYVISHGGVSANDVIEQCPVCGGDVAIRDNDGVQICVCENPVCEGKLINRLDHFFGIKGLNAKGISRATFEKLIDWGWLNDLCDMYNLDDYIDLWKKKPGFGPKSVDKILASIGEASANVSWERFLCALGIPLIGSTVSKDLAKIFNSWDEFRQAIKNNYKFYDLPNFGFAKHDAIMKFNYNEADRLAKFYITFSNPELEKEASESLAKTFDGKVFVVTGKLQTFKNRAELQADIEKHGGKVTGSISKNTNYLINNDKNSTSTKNIAAQKLGIPIISEAEYREMSLQF